MDELARAEEKRVGAAKLRKTDFSIRVYDANRGIIGCSEILDNSDILADTDTMLKRQSSVS